MASPFVHARLQPALYQRVVQAAEAEGVSVSRWLRLACLERLGGKSREALERAELLAEARRYLTETPRSAIDRDAASLVTRYVRSLESVAGRISEAERRGRARALAEVAAGALTPLDGEVVTFPAFQPGEAPPALETTEPRRRGFLREALAAERARALLQAPPPPSDPPSAAALLGEERVREAWSQAISWPGWRRAFCRWHGVVPTAPGDEGRCYLGCSLDSPEVA